MGKGTNGKVCLPKCCFCLELKTGVLVLGILSSILIGITLIAYIVQGAILGIAFGLASGANVQVTGDAKTLWDWSLAMLAIWIIGAVVNAVYFICSILLAVGASKEKPGLLAPWMVMCIISIILALVVIIIQCCSPPVPKTVGSKTIYISTISVSTIIANAVGIALQVYFFIVVKSLYNKLKGYAPAPQIA